MITTVQTVALTDVAVIERAGVDPTSLDPETRYLGLEHIERGGRIIGHGTVGGAALASTKFRFTPEHVLFGKLRPNLGKIARPGFEGVSSTDILPIKPGPRLDRDFLTHFLRQPSMVDYAATRTSGANLPRLSPTVLATFKIPLPPLEEQRRIAAILDQADAIRTRRLQVLAHLDALTHSAYHAMFGERDWPRTSVVSLAVSPDDIKTGPFGTQLKQSEFRATGVPLLGIKNVNSKFGLPPWEFLDATTATRLSAYAIRPGDIVMTRKGTIGNCAIYPLGAPDAVMHSDLLRLRVDSDLVDATYLEHQFHLSPRVTRQIELMSPGAVMPGINVGKLKQLEVDVPPLALQHDFADRVSAINAVRAVVERALAADDELFASLQYRAFRGEL